jgi:insulysin
VEKETSRQDHPYSKFTVGNAKTLRHEPVLKGIKVKDELIKFHTKFYSSNQMTVCLYDHRGLDEIQNLAVKHFSSVPNRNQRKLVFKNDPFYIKNESTIKYTVPLLDARKMQFTWLVPENSKTYQSNPYKYVSHLISHEGSHSLSSKLKRQGYINSLSAHCARQAYGFSTFHIDLDLTVNGFHNHKSVLGEIVHFISMIRRVKPFEHIHDELNTLGKIKFTFKEKESSPAQFVTKLAQELMYYPIERVLVASHFTSKPFEAGLIASACQSLSVRKMRVSLISKDFAGLTDCKETWFGVDYKVDKVDIKDACEACVPDSKLSFPRRNRFVPRDFRVLVRSESKVESSGLFPKKIYSSATSQLWYKADDEFKQPKAMLKFRISNPFVCSNAKMACVQRLFVDAVNDSLREELYQANLAGFVYSVVSSVNGIVISVFGFSHKLKTVLDTILNRIFSLKIDPERFEHLKAIV